MDGDVKDEIPRAEPAMTAAVKSKGRLRCVCRRTGIRAPKCGALAGRTRFRFEIASVLVVSDRVNAVGWVNGPTRRPTRRTNGAIIQCKGVLYQVPTEYTPEPRDRDRPSRSKQPLDPVQPDQQLSDQNSAEQQPLLPISYDNPRLGRCHQSRHR